MLAVGAKPCLQLIPGAVLEARIESVPSRVVNVGRFAEENRAKLKQLRRDRAKITQIALATGIAGITAFAVYSITAAASFPALWKIAEALSTVTLRFFLMPELLAAFEAEDVAVEVGLKPGEGREIDFFLRFPDKEYVLIQIHSVGKSKLVYNENKQAFQTKRRNKAGLKTWKTDPLAEFMEQERWIRRERTDLLGTTAKDRRRPIAKVLVAWSDDEEGGGVADHSEALYSRINESRYLTIRKTGTVYVVPRNQINDFIKDYLASRRSS